jgi:hypothetical protein
VYLEGKFQLNEICMSVTLQINRSDDADPFMDTDKSYIPVWNEQIISQRKNIKMQFFSQNIVIQSGS